ncbi:hypothetical protein HMN09_00205200 [Mycena chlorophos]|uniref:GATA-type domain-containing protein n=1 Tax=Mycena chlorophos TaxID=658473 RepID=A0A8H6TLF4_MYCCL|nr:hypothetical protein HMN09_00205200 [Mycena chlorophos]
MPSILNLKFKGNKSFVAFSNLGDAESLTKTWKVCTKVASYLEQGQRLENLSWRLWHLQNLMVDTDNAKSKREFKKLSKCMGDKLDKEKGRSIEELPAPAFQRNPSTDLIRQRAAEKERVREAHANTPDHIIQRMQFTFAVEPVSTAAAATTTNVTKNTNTTATTTTNTTSPATGGTKRKLNAGGSVRLPTVFSSSFGPEALLATTQSSLAPRKNYGDSHSPYLNTTGNHASGSSPGDMRISRPTIELPLDELLNADLEAASDFEHDAQESSTDDHYTSSHMQPVQPWSWDELMRGSTHMHTNNTSAGTFDPAHGFGLSFPMFGPSPGPNDASPLPLTLDPHAAFGPQPKHEPMMSSISSALGVNFGANNNASTPTNVPRSPHLSPNAYFANDFGEDDAMDGSRAVASAPRNAAALDDDDSSDDGGDDSADSDFYEQSASVARTRATRPRAGSRSGPSTSGVRKSANSSASAPRRPTSSAVSAPTSKRPVLSVRVPASARPPAQAPAPASSGGAGSHTAPGGVKAECSNCGATHTPLWRRGLNDELNCNACGLYCKLHKRPRPKTMRQNGGQEGRGQSVRAEAVDVMAQCYNCHTTATPLWRKDDEGKTVCNACGLYYKLHGSARPISMKSDVIRKRSRHDARRGGPSANAETPTASPGVSRRASPAPGASGSTSSDSTGRSSPVLSADTSFDSSTSANESKPPTRPRGFVNPFSFHDQALNDALPFASIDVAADADTRVNKRRRMSIDSASEPPSSATSYSSYNDGTGYSASSSQYSSEFPFSRFPNVGYNSTTDKRGSVDHGVNSFWHPPMLVQEHQQPGVHPPMLPATVEEDYAHTFFNNAGYSVHPPMLPMESNDWMVGGGGAHPPMMPYDEMYDGTGMHY